MGSKVVVTGSFTVEWGIDEFREQCDDAFLTDEEILTECLASVDQDWDQYATHPDTAQVQGEIVG